MTRSTIKTFLSDEQLKDSYDKTLPVLWYIKAQDLLNAARLLEPHDQFFDSIKTQKGFSETKINLMSVILMLRGMAMECLLKGELTKQGMITSRDGELDLPNKYQGHNLSNMAQDVSDLTLGKDEHVTLETLGQQIMLARLPLKKSPTKAQMESGAWDFPHDEEVYLKILDKILTLSDSKLISDPSTPSENSNTP